MLEKTTIIKLGKSVILILCVTVFSLLINCAKQPKITNISPDTGQAGTAVTIEGENFNQNPANNKVMFADNQKAEVKSASSTRIETIVPPKAISGVIIVTTEAGTAVSERGFKALKCPCRDYPGEGSIIIDLPGAVSSPWNWLPNGLVSGSTYRDVIFNPTGTVYYRGHAIEIYGKSNVDMSFGGLPCEVHEVTVDIKDNFGDAKLEGTCHPCTTNCAKSAVSLGKGSLSLTITANQNCYFNVVRLSGQEVLFFGMTLN